MTRQQSHRRDRQRSVVELPEDLRKQPARTCGLDAVVRRVFGQAEHVAAVGEERRLSGAQVEPPRVGLREMATSCAVARRSSRAQRVTSAISAVSDR